MEKRERDILISALEVLKGDIARDNRTDFNVREINRLEAQIENAAQIDIVPGLSATAREKYLEDPKHCPFCGSGGLVVKGPVTRSDDKQVHQDMLCNSCKRTWTEVFYLKEIDVLI
jgi:formate dehydrogenase maturation protein FdhE